MKPQPHPRRLLGSIEPVEPTTDRLVPSRKVPCTACGAQVGERCVSKNGTPVRSPHRERRRRAIREGL